MNSKYICFNGEFVKTENPYLDSLNSIYLQGFFLRERMFAANNKVAFFKSHFNKIIADIQYFNLQLPEKLHQNPQTLEIEISKLLIRNKHFLGAEVVITIFLSNQKPTVSYLIETFPLQNVKFILNEKGIKTEIVSNIKIPVNPLFSFDCGRALISVFEKKHISETSVDELLYLNEKENVIESDTGNIFACFENRIITPPFEDSCLIRNIRNTIISIILEYDKFKFAETHLKESDLLIADEIFITNERSGIVWIGAFRERRYYNTISRFLIEKLNQIAFI